MPRHIREGPIPTCNTRSSEGTTTEARTDNTQEKIEVPVALTAKRKDIKGLRVKKPILGEATDAETQISSLVGRVGAEATG